MYHPRLRGNHYEMGYKYGGLLYRNGVRFEETVHLTPEQFEFGMKSLDVCRHVYPEIVEEMRGMSDGLHYPLDHFAGFLLSIGVFDYDHGCTCVCFRQGEDIIFARNHDMFSVFKKTTESALIRPDEGYAFLGQGDALIGKEDGVNEHGLAVGMTYVTTKYKKPGLNFLFLVRFLLEKCANVAEALRALKALPIATSQNIVLADREGDMAVVECCSEEMQIRRPEKDQHFLVATNHFLTPAMIPYDGKPEANWYQSQTRYMTSFQALLENNSSDAIQHAMDILSGKLGFVCQYNRSLKFDSLWSFIVRLNDSQIYRAEGNPSRTKYTEDTRLTWLLTRNDRQ